MREQQNHMHATFMRYTLTLSVLCTLSVSKYNTFYQGTSVLQPPSGELKHHVTLFSGVVCIPPYAHRTYVRTYTAGVVHPVFVSSGSPLKSCSTLSKE